MPVFCHMRINVKRENVYFAGNIVQSIAISQLIQIPLSVIRIAPVEVKIPTQQLYFTDAFEDMRLSQKLKKHRIFEMDGLYVELTTAGITRSAVPRVFK